MAGTLFPLEQISEYHTAAEVKAVADAAPLIQLKNSIAKQINLAANSGQHVVRVRGDIITKETRQMLEADGYVVKPIDDSAAEDQYDISWETTV